MRFRGGIRPWLDAYDATVRVGLRLRRDLARNMEAGAVLVEETIVLYEEILADDVLTGIMTTVSHTTYPQPV